ncbi:MAG: hypothetical protein II412_03740 [Clostridia bacterium]|nr:hypothetical protein [Clostridia bacterium]
MKRTAILILALMLLAALGCGANGTDDPNAVFIDPNAVHGGEYGELYFESNGVRFGIYDEAEAVLSALPAYRSTFTGKSCAFESEDVSYFYAGFTIMTNEIDGTDRITGIKIDDDTVKTPQGLYIGMSAEDAAAAFPAAKEADWSYADGTALLSVTIADDVVKGIVYTPVIPED